jgi:hypothetical protein
MITDFEDLCTWVFVIVDDIWQQIAPYFQRPGPAPLCSDSELITMALIGEARGLDSEREMLAFWREHRDLFPHIPSQSRFNRRRRNLWQAFNWIRRILLRLLDIAQDTYCVIDSLPVPVMQFYLVPSSPAAAAWQAYGATFGKVSSRKEIVFGYKLHLLITFGGLILDFVLAPANASDLAVGAELLPQHPKRIVIADKGYVSAPVAARLWSHHSIRLYAIPRQNQKQQWPEPFKRLVAQYRQIIESVNHQLANQFHIERNRAHSFWGLATRLHTKLAAHTLLVYLNRLLGKTEWLQIKALAFPQLELA